MNIMNMTPHQINICHPNGELIRSIPPSGRVFTVDESAVEPIFNRYVEYLEATGIPVAKSVFVKTDAPTGDADTIYIVSALAGAIWRGENIFTPGTGPGDNPVRVNGQIVGVTRLKQTV